MVVSMEKKEQIATLLAEGDGCMGNPGNRGAHQHGEVCDEQVKEWQEQEECN